jgi:hypothetical protein
MGCNAMSLTLQTSTGPKTSNSTDAVFYQVDTEPANSGSPIIRTSTDFAIGVHTNGGCFAGGGANSGTLLTQSVIAQSLDDFMNGATFVDHTSVGGLPLGTALNPVTTVPLGIGLTPSGGTVAIAGGSYTAAAGNTGVFNSAVTLTAVSGVVTIGQ